MNDVYTLNPLLSSPGGLIYFKPIWEGGLILIQTRAYLRRGLINLETTMVSVLRKELEVQVREVLGHAAEDQNQIRTSS